MHLSQISLALTRLSGQFSPASLFAAGEVGAWYDPSDLTTLFTDSAGTTPVTAVEQFVGLMLDKRVPVAQTGYYSGVFDGTNDSLSVGTVSSFNFMHNPTALFTFECWVNVASTASAIVIADNTSATTAQTGFFVSIAVGGAVQLAITNSNGVSPSIVGGTSSSTVSANTWTHIAFTYDQSLASANAKFYINGVAAGTLNKTAATPSSGNASQILRIGANNPSGFQFNGYISNLRITNSIVYTGAFTPPTIPLTAVANTQLLTCQNSTFIDNSPNNFAITANGGIVAGARNPFGNHATQTTSAKRPKLAARYNLLTYTEQFDNGYWDKSTWPVTITADDEVAPNGTTTADLMLEQATSNRHGVFNASALTPVNGLSYVYSVYAKAAGRSYLVIDAYTNANAYTWFNLATGQVETNASGNVATITAAGNGWYRCTVQRTSTSSSNQYIGIYAAPSDNTITYAGDIAKGLYIWGADLRPASQATGLIGPTYQRVVDAATYDTVGFLPYLQFDGLSWSMSTGSIDFSATDKITVWAGVRKLSDDGFSIVSEIGSGGQNGSFYLAAPVNASATYTFYSKGNLEQLITTPASYAAPITNVICGIGNISGDQSIIRVNGSQAAANIGDQGTGNYGNYQMYIGARTNSARFLNGWLSSLIVRGAQSTQSQIEATESWVNGKTGAY